MKETRCKIITTLAYATGEIDSVITYPVASKEFACPSSRVK